MSRIIAFRTLTRTVALLFVALLLTPLTSLPLVVGTPPVAAQVSLQAVADGFDFPVGDVNGGGWTFGRYGFESYGLVYAGAYHAGEDWARSGTVADQPVYAIGNGVVRSVSSNYPGGVVIIEHRLANGEIWYSMYGHVNSKVSVGQSVSRRQQIATIFYQYNNSHLHFEVRNFHIRNEVNGAQSACSNHRNYPPGPGYWPRCGAAFARPLTKGWVNPSQFISAHRSPSSVPVGQGSSRQDVFQRAYDTTKSGTVANINYGNTTNATYWNNGFVRQDFSGGVSLIHDESFDSPPRSIPVYPIYGAIKSYWEANVARLGAPTTNQFRNSVGQDEQHFRSGYVTSSGTLATTRLTLWPTYQDCLNRGAGLWRLEATNLSDVGTASWPPNRNLTAGPSTVVCANTSRSGYAFFYDVGSASAAVAQGLEVDHWMVRLSGTISGLASGLWPARAACDDGCDVQIKTANMAWLTQRIVSWQDQPASSLNPPVGVRNGDQVTATLYDHGGAARVWLKLGLTALMAPPLAATCDATIALADGAPMVKTLSTTLTLSATNAMTVGVGFKADLSDATWQPYTTTLPIQLAPSSSIITQTVYAQFLDSTGQSLCEGAILDAPIVFDPLPPTGTATVAANDALSVTLQLDASDQADGSGIADVAIMLVVPGQPATDPTTLSAEAWQAYSASVNIPKPMSFEAADPTTPAALAATTDLTYQVWFRDALGNIAAPLTVTVPYVAPAPAIFNVYLPSVQL